MAEEPVPAVNPISKIVNTRIKEVTVYTNRALVIREGQVSLSGAEQELVVEALPLTLQVESIRAHGTGTVAVSLLGVRTEHIYATEPVEEKVAAITRQVKDTEARLSSVRDKLAASQMQRSFVQELSNKSVERFSTGLARKQVGLEDTSELLNFLGKQYNDFSVNISGLEKEYDLLKRQLEALQFQLNQVSTPQTRESYNVVVDIETAGKGDFTLELSYVVDRASWNPLYDLRVNETGKKVNLNYLAEVQQNTGEDWTGVGLTLSTAKPGLGVLPPKLDPWYIDIIKPVPPVMTRAFAAAPGHEFMKMAPQPAPMAAFQFEEGESGAVFDSFEAQSVNAGVSSEGGVVTFRLNRDSNIPNDGNPHKVTIFNEEYPCRFEFIAIPRLVSFAYLQTGVTNQAGGATLLPGPANIFRENTFVGTTHLENIAPGQEFKLNLGIDEGLKIERDLIEREVDKKLIGNQRRITYGYRLVVANLRDREATLKLTEQLPVTRSEQIKVRLNRTTPQVQSGEMGQLEWNLILPPNTKKELYYQFTVEHPTDVTLTGLNI